MSLHVASFQAAAAQTSRLLLALKDILDGVDRALDLGLGLADPHLDLVRLGLPVWVIILVDNGLHLLDLTARCSLALGRFLVADHDFAVAAGRSLELAAGPFLHVRQHLVGLVFWHLLEVLRAGSFGEYTPGIFCRVDKGLVAGSGGNSLGDHKEETEKHGFEVGHYDGASVKEDIKGTSKRGTRQSIKGRIVRYVAFKVG